MRRTKIVCTLGPASQSEEVIEKMLLNGMNVARLNFSHGDYDFHRNAIETFRKVRDRLAIPAAVMLDTKGPEIRLGNFENNKVKIETGQRFTLTTRDVMGTDRIASVTYKDLPRSIPVGCRILIDDGKVRLKPVEVTDTDIICEVTFGGAVSNHKSINVPNVSIDMPYLSEADKSDLRFGVEMDVDFIAASFVRTKEDVIALRKYVDYYGGHDIKIISKIENRQGVDNFEEILRYSDGIMVARGDMGVEVEFEQLPGIQKKFIRKCYQSGKIVITATQMLESMVNSITPTRAEISDVANAVFDGTSAVMLSGETTIGIDPPNVVKTMATIAEQAEKDAIELNAFRGLKHDVEISDRTNAICDAACTTARDLHAKAIIASTESGSAARGVSKFRPEQPIVAPTPNVKTYHQLAMSWGVQPVLALNQHDVEQLCVHAIDCAKTIDVVSAGDNVVITVGSPLHMAGGTNTLRVETVK